VQIAITARNLELTPALRQYAEGKLKKLEKYLDNITSAHVILSIEKHRQIAEATLHVRDLTIRGQESTDDLYSSIDRVLDKLERQILKYKEKLVARSGRGGSKGEGLSPLAEEEPEVVKVKRFAIKPLSVEEAVVQMNLLSHSFFVFRNARTDEVNVLYRRKDGNYGLIEPEA